MRQHTLFQIFALVPATVSRYLLTALPLETLKSIPDARVSWPTGGHESHELSALVSRCHPQRRLRFDRQPQLALLDLCGSKH